ncbi:MAG: heavy-metal-associated domain-containing protein [Candidatus Methanomethylophilaceae archaeon]
MVKGMTCGKCSGRVQKAIESVPGVRSAQVDHKSGKAKVVLDKNGPGTEAIKEAVRKAGYDPQ